MSQQLNNLPQGASLVAVAAAISPFWFIEGSYVAGLWPVLSRTNAAHHIRAYREDGTVLDVKTGEHIQPYGLADRTGVHRVPLSQDANGVRKPYAIDGGVALLAITGPTTKDGPMSLEDGTSTVIGRRVVRQARIDPDVKSVALRVDSPGGDCAGADDFAADIAKLASEKPTYGYAEDLCASCGYYYASQCNAIYANPSARIGSIATVWPLVDSSGMFEQLGLQSKLVKPDDAPFKGSFFPGTPITDEHMAYAQSIVDEYARQFRKAVQRARGLTDEQMKAVTDGRCFPAAEARALGLIDGVTSYDKMLAKLKTYKPA